MTTRVNEDNFDETQLLGEIGGSAPTISNVWVTDDTYANISNYNGLVIETNVYLVFNGANFDSNTRVLLGNVSPSSTTLVSDTQLRTAFNTIDGLPYGSVVTTVVDEYIGTSTVYFNLVTLSDRPTWSTSATLANAVVSQPASFLLAAESDSNITYTVADGSSLPGNLSLLTNGYMSGYVTSTGSYSFDIVATDEETQTTTRSFSLTVIPEPPMDAYVTGSNVTTTTYTYGGVTYTAHVFLESGTFQINAFSNLSVLNTVDMFLVGGGAGGAGDQGGGGGGGVANNYVNVSDLATNEQYTVVVGLGGGNFAYGGNTSVAGGSVSLLAPGGGAAKGLYGGNAPAWYTGGGGGGYDAPGATAGVGGTGFLGFSGGTGGTRSGGGGGGMGSAGSNGGGTCSGGMGGNGAYFAQYAALGGSPAGYWGGGGRGGSFSGSSSTSIMTNTATGGGGDGMCGGISYPGTGSELGDAGSGGGGGGGIANSATGAGRGAPGGHGIVIIRYRAS